ncbi:MULTISPECIES: hypothetical protein [Streptomyces]|uniref:UDP-N-acetylmuramyl pentapeptide phosphotransferase/UDP-N-acetylglucosamine-1-phosphate transferase n=1 Tax=Streptomyces cyaneofuscatus TaxID=66883 RepID=A0ABZ1ES35_9ACTN|nr:hypothetical protein [Streptomyces cyaneofuscatus]WSB06886.1 hypothetical protein OG849_06365 [Streptomyces cyaneofuscatus]WSD49579.1 hypothetical protein OG857_29030 [Streptomyces cyaneofuscatus]
MGTNVSRAVVVAGLVGAGAAAGVAAGVYAVLGRRTDPAWLRTNHAGRAVTLYAGPAAVLGGAAGIAAAPGPVRERAAGVLAVLVAGGCGAYDDLVGAEDPRRGFRAHLGALRGGEVTSGAVKLFGIGAAGVLAGLLIEERAVDGVLSGVVIAGTAHLVNLVDVGPGVAVASVAVLGAVAGMPGAAAAVVLGPADLGERAMLGDTGAHGLGAALGIALARRGGRRGGRTGRAALAVALVAAAANGERVSGLARRASGVLRRAAGVAGR